MPTLLQQRTLGGRLWPDSQRTRTTAPLRVRNFRPLGAAPDPAGHTTLISRSSTRDPGPGGSAPDAPSSPNQSPGWNPLARLFSDGGGGQGGGAPRQGDTMPLADVSLSDAASLPIFRLLERVYLQHGPIVRMRLGPRSFVVVSDPSYAKQILVNSVDRYSKGILAEILEFVMGQGLLSADGELWMARRRAVAPALQRKFVASQVALFGTAAARGLPQLDAAAATRGSVEMEAFFSRLSLDVVGKSIFDYDFNALTNDDPVIQAVYTVLKEAESRSTAPFPFWKLPLASLVVPRLRRSAEAVATINSTLDRLVAKCRAMLEEDAGALARGPASSGGGPAAGSAPAPAPPPGWSAEEGDAPSPSVLHFLVSTTAQPGQAAADLISSKQLRDDLITLLVAGHETTAAALTWALHMLVQHPEAVAKIRQEVDAVCGDELPTAEDLPLLRYTSRVVSETLRLFPQPPMLFRRAEQEDVLGGVHVIPPGTDVILSVWNLHHSAQHWEDPEAFRPERFGPLDGPQPSEANTDFRFLPFGGGRRKCVGDQFALAQAVVALAVLLRRYDFAPDPAKPPVGMTTGATIHTTAGLHMLVSRRDLSGVPPPARPRDRAAVTAGAGGAAAAAAAAAGACPHAAAAAVEAAAAAAAGGGCPHAAAAAAAAEAEVTTTVAAGTGSV